MPVQQIDSLGHEVRPAPSTTLTAGAVGVVTAGSISGTTAAGAAPTVAIPTGFVAHDRAGTFELTAVTGGGAQAAGDVATVRFNTEYPAVPSAVMVTLHDITANPDVAKVVCATAVTTAGFNVNVAAALTTATVYRTSYVVIP